jgi:hypothetical protein
LITFVIVASIDVAIVGLLNSAIGKIAFQEHQARLASERQKQANEQIALDLQATTILRDMASCA